MSPEPAPAATRVEAGAAFSNALKLASSLLVSFGITLALRQLVIPRYLGTERLGELNYADGWAGVFLVAAWLGVDTWIRKEIGVSVKSADGYFGGILAVRTAFMLVLTTALGVTPMHLLGRSNEIVITGVVFGVAQLMTMMQNTASALLHAAGRVDGLSVTNIIGKVVWGIIVVPVLLLQLSLVWLAVAFALSEGFKAIASTVLAVKHTNLKLHVDLKITFAAMKASAAFWVNAIALAGTGRADVAVLGTLCVSLLGTQAAANREVGWYTVVLGFGSMLMVVTPVLSWVLLPLLSRALARGEDEGYLVVRRAVEICIVLSMPLSVGAFVAAGQLMAPPFYRAEFAPAALVLRTMAPTYLLTYLNIVSANCLAGLNRGWTLTLTSVAMVGMTPLLDLVLIPPALAHFGPSGGAAACAASMVFAETLTVGIMLNRLGRKAVDARLVSVVIRTLITAGGVIALDVLLQGQPSLRPWFRIGIDALAYVGLALGTRSIRVSEAIAFVKLARATRSGAVA